VLLVHQATAGAMLESLATPRAAASGLSEIAVDRVMITPSVTTRAALTTLYRTACNALHGKITGQLTNLYAACGALLPDLFPTNPAPGWIERLQTLNAWFQTHEPGIQYYYDFVKDVVETYNDFRRLLLEDSTVCCPGVHAFSKHLLLGKVVPDVDPNVNRTGLYPSVLVSSTVERWWHAKGLAAKLNVLMQAVQLPPPGGQPLRITPSRFEERALEERAIPFYYQTGGTLPIHRVWNFALARAGMAAWNYSYNAADYAAQGGAAHPLTTDIGPFPFFRIEGHQGQPVGAVLDAIGGEISTNNLPFVVRALLLGTDPSGIRVKPTLRFSDLHRVLYLVRHAVTTQLDDLADFNDQFTATVNTAVAAGGAVTNPPNVDITTSVGTYAAQQHATLSTSVAAARAHLAANDPSWSDDLRTAAGAAAAYRYQLGSFVSTDFLPPFESLVASPFASWVTWLETLIQAKDAKEDRKLLFHTFLGQHPGAEHFGGVFRGGTFILVYDETGTVVADFTLPYDVPETADQEAETPPLSGPTTRLPWSTSGIRVRTTPERLIGDRLATVQTELQRHDVMLEVMHAAPPLPGGVVVNPVPQVQDPGLLARLTTLQDKRAQVQTLQTQSLDPQLSAEAKTVVDQQLKSAETDLAQAAADTGRYVATKDLPVAQGSDGYTAMVAVSDSAATLTSPDGKSVVKQGLTDASALTKQAGLQNMIGTIIQRRGM